jgi:hypothetical protein
MKTKPKIVTGEFSEHGYAVFISDRPYYSAGNCLHDSAIHVPPGSPDAVPLRQIRSYCARTARDIAQEVGGAFTGVERNGEHTN